MLHCTHLKRGRGTPFVFLHGFLGVGADWVEVAHCMDAPCIAVDLPGHGHSPFTPNFESALSETLGETPVHLVGYSMGGRLALRYARAHPEMIASLNLIGTHLGLTTDEELRERAERNAMWAHRLRTLPIDEFLAYWYAQPLFQTLGARVPLKRRCQSAEGLARALETFELGKREELPEGTRLLVGEHDTAYRALYSGLSAEVIAGAGHAAHLEAPEAVAAAMKYFKLPRKRNL